MTMVLVAIFAVGSGMVIGLFGAGGSILMIPILVYVLHLPIKVAIGMTLLIEGITGLIAATAHARQGNVFWKVGIPCSIFGMVGAYFGARVTEFINPVFLLLIFAVVVLGAAIGMLRAGKLTADEENVEPPKLPKIAGAGGSIGFLTGMVGVGGGFLLVPCLNLLCKIQVKRAIGTSLVIIGLKSFAGFIGFTAHTAFPWAILLTVAGFNSVGSLIGEKLNERLPTRRLKTAFAILLLIIGAMTLLQNIIKLKAGGGIGGH